MKSFFATAAFAAAAVLADVQLITAESEMAILCPDLDGQSIGDSGGAKYSVSCDWTIESEGKAVEVEGDTSPFICMEACEESEDCYSVNIAADGGCSIISGKEQGMQASAGSINLFRLPQAVSAATPVSITTTRTAPTSSISSTAINLTPSMPSPSIASAGCDLILTNLCPACDDTIAVDASGNSYHIYCDSSLFTKGTYSVQEYLSPEGCLKECDDLSWCMGASYYDDRSCEIAKGPVVYPVPEAGYTAFLPVASSAATSTARSSGPSVVRTSLQTSIGSIAPNQTTTSTTPDPTVSILPISNVCNTSSLTCPACDGISVDDTLDQTYTALCTFAPVCDSTAIMDGPVTQDECMQGCDQDATCLAVLWYTDLNACHLCQQGLDGGPGEAADFVLLVADIDGDDDDSPTSTTSSNYTYSSTTSATTRPSSPSSYPIYGTGSWLSPGPYSSGIAQPTAGSLRPTAYQSPSPTTGPMISNAVPYSTAIPGGPYANTTRSASVPNISAAVCPGLGVGVFVDPSSSDYFEVACDNIVTGANSHYITASNLAACVALCSADCDGVQFGYSTRCGLYQDMTAAGPGTGWTVAARLTYPESTGMPTAPSTTMATVTSGLESYPDSGKRAAYRSWSW